MTSGFSATSAFFVAAALSVTGCFQMFVGVDLFNRRTLLTDL
jgi:hypothetical protein